MRYPITVREIVKAPELTSWSFKFTKKYVDEHPDCKYFLKKRNWLRLIEEAKFTDDEKNKVDNDSDIKHLCEIWTDASGKVLYYCG